MLIPLSVDVPMWRRPWVNYILTGTVIAVSLACFADSSLFIKLSGLNMAAGMDHLPIPVLTVTSVFVHAGFIHLIGNMIFLWIFGNAVNYKFGQIFYLAFFLICAISAGMFHYAFETTPVVGASGAINGVMGAFLVFFPRNNIRVLLVIYFVGKSFYISSIWVILMWVGWDFLFLSLGAETGIALWSHVGGFSTGFLIALATAAFGWIKPDQDEQTLLQVLSGSGR